LLKTRYLIIIGAITIGVIVASTVGTMEYQSAYNQNCNSDGGYVVGFLKCIYINEDFGVPIPEPDTGGADYILEKRTSKFSDLSCEEIVKNNNIGLIYSKNDTSFSQERIIECLKEIENKSKP